MKLELNTGQGDDGECLTIELPAELAANLTVLGLTHGSVEEHAVRAMAEYLERLGLNPHKMPKVEVSY